MSIKPQPLNGIVDDEQNAKLLMESDAQLGLKLMAGKAEKVLDIHRKETGWYSRNISRDAICNCSGGGKILFKLNPLTVVKFESGNKPEMYANAYAQSYAIDHRIL